MSNPILFLAYFRQEKNGTDFLTCPTPANAKSLRINLLTCEGSYLRSPQKEGDRYHSASGISGATGYDVHHIGNGVVALQDAAGFYVTVEGDTICCRKSTLSTLKPTQQFRVEFPQHGCINLRNGDKYVGICNHWPRLSTSVGLKETFFAPDFEPHTGNDFEVNFVMRGGFLSVDANGHAYRHENKSSDGRWSIEYANDLTVHLRNWSRQYLADRADGTVFGDRAVNDHCFFVFRHNDKCALMSVHGRFLSMQLDRTICTIAVNSITDLKETEWFEIRPHNDPTPVTKAVVLHVPVSIVWKAIFDGVFIHSKTKHSLTADVTEKGEFQRSLFTKNYKKENMAFSGSYDASLGFNFEIVKCEASIHLEGHYGSVVESLKETFKSSSYAYEKKRIETISYEEEIGKPGEKLHLWQRMLVSADGMICCSLPGLSGKDHSNDPQVPAELLISLK